MRKTHPDVPRVYVIEGPNGLLLVPGFFLSSEDAYEYINERWPEAPQAQYYVAILSSQGIL